MLPTYYFDELKEDNLAAKLSADRLPLKEYIAAHQGLVIPCHDVFIEINGKILLVQRDNQPAKDLLWPIGGRILRGLSAEDSLIKIAYQECGLTLSDLRFLGVARTYFGTDPFEHGKGSDTLNLVYFAKGKGEISLDSLHSPGILIDKVLYDQSYKGKLSKYVCDFLEKIWD